MSSLVDSGSFLVNGGLRCLVAEPRPCSETDGGDQGDSTAAKMDACHVVCVRKSHWVQVLHASKAGNTSKSAESCTHAHVLANFPEAIHGYPTMTCLTPTPLITTIASLRLKFLCFLSPASNSKIHNVTLLTSLWPHVSFNTMNKCSWCFFYEPVNSLSVRVRSSPQARSVFSPSVVVLLTVSIWIWLEWKRGGGRAC